MKLKELELNKDNPRVVEQSDIDRLAGKLKRVPDGLKAIRIAYVVDEDGRKIVLSGNTRLKALRQMYGDDFECPDEWFQDITFMTPEQRKEFIVVANVNDGEWDIDKLLKSYDVEYLNDLGMQDVTTAIPTDVDLTQFFKDKPPVEIVCEQCGRTFNVQHIDNGEYYAS